MERRERIHTVGNYLATHSITLNGLVDAISNDKELSDHVGGIFGIKHWIHTELGELYNKIAFEKVDPNEYSKSAASHRFTRIYAKNLEESLGRIDRISDHNLTMAATLSPIEPDPKGKTRVTHEASINGETIRLWVIDTGTDSESRYTLFSKKGDADEVQIVRNNVFGVVLAWLHHELKHYKNEYGVEMLPKPELDTPDDTPQPTYDTLKDTLENNTGSQ